MKGHTFVQQSKLTNVNGRIKYISSHAKQENLYAVYETTDRSFWRELAAENQTEFMRSGTEGKCIEARELIIALPKSLYLYDHNELLKYMVDVFKDRYGVECIAALHHNKRRTNFHIHLIYSERKRLEEPIIKIATRNIFIDETGKRRRTKKEILKEDGDLRTGCKIIPKGEVYEKHLFDKKETLFKDKAFLDDVKNFYTEVINEHVPNDREKLKVFPKDSPYIATKKVGKNNPYAKEIRENNRIKDEWNRQVDAALRIGMPKQSLMTIKEEEIISPINEAIEAGINRQSAVRVFVDRAARTLMRMIKELFRMDPDIIPSVLTDQLKSFTNFCRAPLKSIRREEKGSR